MSLSELQKKVHVAKDKKNEFGGYNYRTAEGILAAIKAHMPDGAHIIVSDTLQEVAGQIFIVSTATLHLPEHGDYVAQGEALHPLTKKGMDPSQITGAASSYARKYALSGLMALDDGSVDPDAAKTQYEPDISNEVDAAVEGINGCGSMDALKKYWGNLSKNAKHVAADQRVIDAKNVRKSELER